MRILLDVNDPMDFELIATPDPGVATLRHYVNAYITFTYTSPPKSSLAERLIRCQQWLTLAHKATDPAIKCTCSVTAVEAVLSHGEGISSSVAKRTALLLMDDASLFKSHEKYVSNELYNARSRLTHAQWPIGAASRYSRPLSRWASGVYVAAYDWHRAFKSFQDGEPTIAEFHADIDSCEQGVHRVPHVRPGLSRCLE